MFSSISDVHFLTSDSFPFRKNTFTSYTKKFIKDEFSHLQLYKIIFINSKLRLILHTNQHLNFLELIKKYQENYISRLHFPKLAVY